MSKGSVHLKITRIGRAIDIWYEMFCKLIVSVDSLVTRKKVFLESSIRSVTHLDVVVEVLKVHISVSFEFCIYEEFIESWWADLMFQSTPATNFCRLSTIQSCIYSVSWVHSGRVRRLWWSLLGGRGSQIVNLVCDFCEIFFEFLCEFSYFLVRVLLVALISCLLGSILACMMMNC